MDGHSALSRHQNCVLIASLRSFRPYNHDFGEGEGSPDVLLRCSGTTHSGLCAKKKLTTTSRFRRTRFVLDRAAAGSFCQRAGRFLPAGGPGVLFYDVRITDIKLEQYCCRKLERSANYRPGRSWGEVSLCRGRRLQSWGHTGIMIAAAAKLEIHHGMLTVAIRRQIGRRQRTPGHAPGFTPGEEPPATQKLKEAQGVAHYLVTGCCSAESPLCNSGPSQAAELHRRPDLFRLAECSATPLTRSLSRSESDRE
jgi:hypothetical protein